jgi:hyaluronoglucosaminidase
MDVRGMIEGFYGPPWSHAERLDMIAFCGAVGLDTWVHAPKDDPYHRERWREPYPEAELARLADLVAHAVRHGVRFVYAIAPGLDVCYSSGADFDALLTKLEQLRTIDVRHFQLLFDDVEHTLHCAEDQRRYGGYERPSGAAQAQLSNRFAREVAQPGPLVVCPMAYAGTGAGDYRRCFAPHLDDGIVLYWTGPEVVSLAITREELDMSVRRYGGHEHLLWDNYPVNDWDPEVLHLGPLRGRDPGLADGPLRGIVANAMVQATPSKLALATVADWARDPAGYDATASFAGALSVQGGEVLEAVRPLAGDGPAPREVPIPDDLSGLIEALAPGVDAVAAVALLEPFV